ncbi:ABC transporter substrate-binding protein [Nonomuraea guangzhouensis]|uniref:ABC transporter substrate-binding protein n=1 Tax=Nonomuraea guangzhouensis TaxID=1291555 RepID=A0ABW4GXJ7_9ACTN|nr:extracellular solute-binding protein [Nonomuraea guangzhouensis]
MKPRKMWTVALLAATVMTSVAACGSGDDKAGGDKIELRFSYWGSDSRQKLTEQVIKKFEEKNPTINVEGDFSDFANYYEKLATKVAANDAPDVMSIEIRGLGEYAGRGALADMAGKVPTTDFDQQALAAGNIDGKQYGIPSGVNAFSMLVNKATIEKAKQQVPDDKSWTWDDWINLAKQISASGTGLTGAEYNYNPAWLQIFAAQRGEKLYDGKKLGVSADTLKAWWGIHQQLIQTKGSPDAAKSSELIAGGVEQSPLGTNTGATGMWWSNQLGGLSKASGQELTLLRMPKTKEATTGGMFLQPSMFYTVGAKSEHPAEAAKFIDFMTNDPDAAAILLSDRGLPINAKVLAAVKDKLPAVDQKTLAFIDEVRSELGPIAAPPKGALQVDDILKRITEEVVFAKTTPDAAAQKFLTEANAAVAG